MTFGVSMARSFGPVVRGRGRKRNPRGLRRLGGLRATQMQEPSDHALGRSRGGFGTKIHLVCESHGFIVCPATRSLFPELRHEFDPESTSVQYDGAVLMAILTRGCTMPRPIPVPVRRIVIRHWERGQ